MKFTLEHGSTLNDADCVYIGHGVAFDQFVTLMSLYMVKRLFEKAGMNLVSMEKKIIGDQVAATAETWTIRWHHRVVVGGVTITTDTVIPADSTFRDAGDVLAADWRANVIATDEMLDMLGVQLIQTVGGGNGTEIVQASVQCTDLKLDFRWNSKLNIQNQTLGSGAGDDLITDVTNNPLQGFQFEGYGTGFIPTQYNAALALPAGTGFTASMQTGVATFTPNATNVTTEMQNIYKRPPAASGFDGCFKRSAIRLAAGGIKQSFLSYRKVMSWNVAFRLILNDLRSNVTYRKQNIGKFAMLGLQKQCRTGAEQPVNIGYEVNQVYMLNGWETKPAMTPHHIVL